MSGRKKIHFEHSEADLISETKLETDGVTLQSVYQELSQLKSYLTGLKVFSDKRVFNNKTLSEYLGVSTRTLQHWRDEGCINFTQIKDVILYSEADVESFMKKHKRIAFQ